MSVVGRFTIGKDFINSLLQEALKGRNLEACWRVYFLMVSSSFDDDPVFKDDLARLFALCDSLEEAEKLFFHVAKPSIYTWNALIAININFDRTQKALELYQRMQEKGRKPSRVTFLTLLKASNNVNAIELGRWIHEQIVSFGLDSDVTLGNALVDMYAKCGRLKEAWMAFITLPVCDVVAWGAMIAGFIHHNQSYAALELFEKMQQSGLKPNNVIYLSIFKACGCTKALVQGRIIHEITIREERESADLSLGSTIVDMYAKCGSLEEAHKMFNKMPNRNVVAWGAIISGYIEQGNSFLALELFDAMKHEGIEPDTMLFTCILKGCSSIGTLVQGHQIHSRLISSGVDLDLELGNTLLDMYAKLGSLEEAHKAFNNLPSKDATSWNSMIAGLARYGKYKQAEHYLMVMKCQGLQPTDAVFTSILTACNIAGLPEEAQHIFQVMQERYGLTASIEHYNCMIELLSCTGRLSEAESLLQTMPNFPDVTGWTSLLTSCKWYGSAEMGGRCFDETNSMDPLDASVCDVKSC